MITEDMIAPCGLNCAICYDYLREKDPCPGCRHDGPGKSEFCRNICQVIHCDISKNLPDNYCDGCCRFPCSEIMERETRYANAYPLTESPIGNLAFLRKEGMDAFLAREKDRWTCQKCGGTICVHTGKCEACGAVYAVQPLED